MSGTSSTAMLSWNSAMPRMRARRWLASATPSTVVATRPASWKKASAPASAPSTVTNATAFSR